MFTHSNVTNVFFYFLKVIEIYKQNITSSNSCFLALWAQLADAQERETKAKKKFHVISVVPPLY